MLLNISPMPLQPIKMVSYKNSFTLLLIFIGFLGLAQKVNNNGKYRYVDIKLHAGNHLYTGDSLASALENGYKAVEVRYGWQTSTKNEWAQAYGYPSYGVGFYAGYVGDPNILGKPKALYGFVSFPLSRQKRLTAKVDLATGLSFNLKPYDPVTNSSNDAIGSKKNIYFNLNFGGDVILNREINLLFGIDITHFSNGRLYTPNHGLNMAGVNLGARYNFNFNQKKLDKSFQPSKILGARPVLDVYRSPYKKNENNILFYQSVGTVQNTIDEGTTKRFLTATTILEFQHKFSEMHGLSAGLDGFYDASVSDEITNPAYSTYATKFFAAYHGGYDFMFWKLSIRMQAGGYISKAGKAYKGNYFMRPAIKYDFSKRFYAQIGLKTCAGATADWIEFGLGAKVFGW